jgi:hypothetical protein
MLNKRALFLLKKTAPFFLLLLAFGCANRQSPQGGPRDHDPPKLLKATPPNMTRNFKEKIIQLDFDEYFKLSNPYTEISMSPTPAKLPEYKIKKKSIVVTLKDTLEKNTTYVINFGKAIADVNESNVLKNFTYVFSTGNHIDSLSISGQVINTSTGEREKDATVMLFTLRQDSLLFGKKKPTIFINTDTAGNFTLNNLHPDTYRIYALKEISPNKIYDNDKELIAFSKNPIQLTKDTSNVELKLFQAEPDKFRVTKRFDADGKMLFTFNKRLDNPRLQIVYPPDFDKYKIVEFSKTKDSATVFMRNMDFDSLRMIFFDNSKPVDTTIMRKGRKEAFQRVLSFQYNISTDSKLRPRTSLIIKPTYPIESFDASLIELKEDSADVTNFNLEKDTGSTRRFISNYRFRQNANYTLTIDAGAFTDIYGGKNKKAIPKKFTIDKPENYSLLTLKVTVPDTAKSYIVELTDERKNILRTDVIRKNTTLSYKDYSTGKYGVTVIYDDNDNGKWDSGNVKQKRQPENIWVDEALITLRPNWEQETQIAIPKEPVTH